MAYFFSQLPVSKIQMIIGPLLIPYYSQLKNNNIDPSRALLTTTKGVSMLAVPVLAGLCIVAPEAIELVLGAKWLPMVSALRVLSLVAIMQAITVNFSPYLYAQGRPGVVLHYHAVSAAVLPILFLVCAWMFGIAGVYWAWLIGYPGIALYMLLLMQRTAGIDLKTFFYSLAPIFLGVSLMSLVAMMLRAITIETMHPVVSIGIVGIAGAGTYALVLWATCKEDLLKILKLKQEFRRPKAA